MFFTPFVILGAFLGAGSLSASAEVTVDKMLNFLNNYNVVSLTYKLRSFHSMAVRTGPTPGLWILPIRSTIQLWTRMWLAESIVSNAQ